MHIVLTGPMGSGKTTLGRIVADAHGRPFDESDAWIEATFGRRSGEIATSEGIEALHALEARHALEALARTGPRVIAVAASGIDDREVRTALSTAQVIVLMAPAGVLVARIGNDHRRDLGPNPVAAMQALIDRRRPYWEEVADAIIATPGRIDDVIEQVLAAARQ